MNKKTTLTRKIEREIKSILKKQELDINALRCEFCTNNNFRQEMYSSVFNQTLTEPKKKKMDLRFVRYIL